MNALKQRLSQRLNQGFSLARLLAVVNKEFIQMRRDKLTFAMMVGVPLLQLMLFGYAINGDPKHLPTVVIAHEQSEFTRISRGVMLKGNGLIESWSELWPLLLFMLTVMVIGLARFRRTLD